MTMLDEPRVEGAEELEFRDRVRAFLDGHCQKRRSGRSADGVADRPNDDGEAEGTSMLEADSASLIAAAKAYQAALVDAGLGFLTWPKRYGGAELTKRHVEIFNEVAADYEIPNAIFTIGHGMCAPTLLEFGTDEQRDTYLPDLLRGDRLWCQLYSEPGAGSDVASLQTRAVRDGDEWVLNGQKVWTSGAHYCDWGIIIARTNPEAPKHKGITMFVLDMHAPGVEPKPLRQITGAANFNEVFLTDVRVPDADRLGAVDDGWRLSVALLMNERVAIGAAGGGPRDGGVQPLIRKARERGLLGDASIRQGLMQVYIQQRLASWLGQRTRAALKAGRAPGPEGSLGKLLAANIARQQSDLGIAIAGAAGVAWEEGDARGARWSTAVLTAPASAIAGGTSEIQKNIVGERVLGLPKEPQVDRDLPFRDLLVGTQR